MTLAPEEEIVEPDLQQFHERFALVFAHAVRKLRKQKELKLQTKELRFMIFVILIEDNSAMTSPMRTEIYFQKKSDALIASL